MDNTHTLSQVILDSLYRQYDIATANNLRRVNKKFYEGSYYSRLENCNDPISKQEFSNYLKNKIVHKIALMANYYEYTHEKFGCFIIEPQLSGMFNIVHKYSSRSGTRPKWATESIPSYTGSHTTAYIVNSLSYELKSVGYEGEIETIYDVLALYNILINRGSCVTMINKYAKNKALNYFNGHVENFSISNERKLI